MFISNQEKKELNDKLKKLNEIVDKLTVESVVFSARIQALEGKLYQVVKKKTRKKLTDEQRKAKQREYNRRYNLKKRLAKKAENAST